MEKNQTPNKDETAPAGGRPVRKILVPTDFSDCANRAFTHALNLARKEGGAVLLLHVVTPVEGDTYSPLKYTPEASALDETSEQTIYNLLAETIAEQDTEDVVVEEVMLRGRAVAPTVVSYASKENVDLIVIGTHGRRGVRQLLIGSVTEEVLHRASCNVLTVPEHAAPEPGEVQRILGPFDFSDPSTEGMRGALQLAARYGAKLDFLHVVEPPSFPMSLTYKPDMETFVPQIQEAFDDRLSELTADGEDLASVSTELHLEKGPVAATIGKVAEALDADLIVMASHGHSGLEHFFLGSVTERAIRTAPCPVFIVRAGVPAS